MFMPSLHKKYEMYISVGKKIFLENSVEVSKKFYTIVSTKVYF